MTEMISRSYGDLYIELGGGVVSSYGFLSKLVENNGDDVLQLVKDLGLHGKALSIIGTQYNPERFNSLMRDYNDLPIEQKLRFKHDCEIAKFEAQNGSLPSEAEALAIFEAVKEM